MAGWKFLKHVMIWGGQAFSFTVEMGEMNIVFVLLKGAKISFFLKIPLGDHLPRVFFHQPPVVFYIVVVIVIHCIYIQYPLSTKSSQSSLQLKIK